jgi:hypothetical protein
MDLLLPTIIVFTSLYSYPSELSEMIILKQFLLSLLDK